MEFKKIAKNSKKLLLKHKNRKRDLFSRCDTSADLEFYIVWDLEGQLRTNKALAGEKPHKNYTFKSKTNTVRPPVLVRICEMIFD